MAAITITVTFDTQSEAIAFLAGRSAETIVAAPSFTLDRAKTAKLREMLDDDTHGYTLRSVAELCQQSGCADQAEVERLLTEGGIDYVVRTRRSDGAKLIGLAEFN